ncbi:MAG TPA: COX15/CtaA family protein [Cyclobacteriaceae bacterium]|nr:COX15/CtaA family protein [Cyclobacteriaceae bacterium]
MNQRNLKIKVFRKASLITTIAVYLLILVGGVVRSTGSGMGCPDWPKCFGSWVPPTSVDQLPKNYQEIYSNKRVEKNERFVAMLQSLGFKKKAEEIKNDKSILVEQEFNPTKTWIEYVNRLLGAVIGLLIIGTFLYSLPLWTIDRSIVLLSFFNIILVIFQGWIGSIVVSTNLLHWMITVHMVLALLLVCLLLYVHYRSYKLVYPVQLKTEKPGWLYLLLMVSFVSTAIQVVMGTQVREQVDIVAAQFGNLFRGEWVDHLGIGFLIHRSFSILLLAIHIVFVYNVYKHSLRRSNILKWSQMLMLMIILEIVTGIGLSYFALPAFLQPIHLFIGSVIIGLQFIILLLLKDQKQLALK